MRARHRERERDQERSRERESERDQERKREIKRERAGDQERERSRDQEREREREIKRERERDQEIKRERERSRDQERERETHLDRPFPEHWVGLLHGEDVVPKRGAELGRLVVGLERGADLPHRRPDAEKHAHGGAGDGAKGDVVHVFVHKRGGDFDSSCADGALEREHRRSARGDRAPPQQPLLLARVVLVPDQDAGDVQQVDALPRAGADRARHRLVC